MHNFKALSNFMEENGIANEKEVSMKTLTSFKIGGSCKFVAYPKNLDEFKVLIKFCCFEKIPHFFLGNGSNILVSDDGFCGVAISSKKLDKIKILSNNKIYCESGVSLFRLCRFLMDNSLKGLEELYGIPGSLGGAILMNAGAFGREIKDVVEEVFHLDCEGNFNKLEFKDLHFSYRHSVYEDGDNFIVGAILKFEKGNKDEIKKEMEEIMEKRRLKQPLNFPNAGSIFKRPKGFFAAKLIEECGLKGEKVGGAMVSEKHSGFIVNFKDASFSDVKKLIEKIVKTVKIKKKVELETEIKFIE